MNICKRWLRPIALVVAQALAIAPAIADQECDWGGGTLDSMCNGASAVTQLPATLPGFAGISSVEGTAALIGSGEQPPRPPGNRGTLCPDFFVCTGQGQSGYRQVEIDSGANARTSLLNFSINAQEQHTNFAAADIDSLAILQVVFDRGRLTVYLDRGPSSTTMDFRAIHVEDATGIANNFGPVTVNHHAAVSLVVQSTPDALHRLQFEVGNQMLVDSVPSPLVKWGKPLQLRYGSLATIADSFPPNSLVALRLSDWKVRIGELVPYYVSGRNR